MYLPLYFALQKEPHIEFHQKYSYEVKHEIFQGTIIPTHLYIIECPKFCV
ncbi:hypothetical protein LEP1GSC188_0796 [Leptospira weilii serovar Topaz str. LT2116]|uniref:Uncharacterized protein n=1 Tax=Leptospira weilii serovar Topaz str. LT2116 TaxID=1088540 RepID=M3GZA0_9LEPT|nr:hypothetical protein LEP1GSC188_0796 [Leptospira weilii serovar Topaz str. LT2116]